MSIDYYPEDEVYEDRKQRLRNWRLSTMHPSDPDYPEDEDDDISGGDCIRCNRSDCGSDTPSDLGGME